MADKLNLLDLVSLDNQTSAIQLINQNNADIETAFDNTLSLDGSSPNTMAAGLDMDGHRITNLPDPVADTEPATKGYVDAIEAFSTAEGLAQAVTDAEAAQAAAETAETNAETAQTAAEAAAEALQATSTTTLTPVIESKEFTTQADKQFIVGGYVFAVSDSASDVWMSGQVTAYSSTTLTVDVQKIGTATESSDWTITVSGPPGSDGADGADGADFSDDTNLSALDSTNFTNTAGLVTQSEDGVFTVRTLTGTTDLIEVTNGDGADGDPTITVGDSVMRIDQDNVLEDGVSITHTQTTLTGGSSGGTLSLALEDGEYQTVSLGGGAWTINAPTSGTGQMILEVVNTGALDSITLSGFDKKLPGATSTQLTTSGKRNWLFVICHGAYQVAKWVSVN